MLFTFSTLLWGPQHIWDVSLTFQKSSNCNCVPMCIGFTHQWHFQKIGLNFPVTKYMFKFLNIVWPFSVCVCFFVRVKDSYSIFVPILFESAEAFSRVNYSVESVTNVRLAFLCRGWTLPCDPGMITKWHWKKKPKNKALKELLLWIYVAVQSTSLALVCRPVFRDL